jgi:SAM-dependent methyltransferase
MNPILRNVPFTYPWILARAVGNDIKTVLDVGCGEGELMAMLAHGKNWNVTGVELFDDSIRAAQATGVYKKIIKADITNLPLEILSQKFDLVFSSMAVEHIPKARALALIKQMETMSLKRTVVTTIVGFYDFCPLDDTGQEKNPYQVHVSGWEPNEFRQMGYTTRGQGLALVWKEGGGWAYRVPRFMRPLFFGFALLFSPLIYFWVSLGVAQIAHKKKPAPEK